jgi:CRP-like cAMP-binding protein
MLAQALGEEGAALLVPHVETVTLAEHTELFREGESASFLYAILDGEVAVLQVHDGRKVAVAVRGPGSWLGEIGFIDAGPATATVVARGPVRAVRVSQTTLLILANEHPEAASVLLRHVSRQMAERIAQTSSGIVEHVGPGQFRVRKPEEVRSWVSQALGWMFGAGDA